MGMLEDLTAITMSYFRAQLLREAAQIDRSLDRHRQQMLLERSRMREESHYIWDRYWVSTELGTLEVPSSADEQRRREAVSWDYTVDRRTVRPIINADPPRGDGFTDDTQPIRWQFYRIPNDYAALFDITHREVPPLALHPGERAEPTTPLPTGDDPCPSCEGKVRRLGDGNMFCLDCDWDNLKELERGR